MSINVTRGFEVTIRELGHELDFHDASIDWFRVSPLDRAISVGLVGFTGNVGLPPNKHEERYTCELVFDQVSLAEIELDGETLYDLSIDADAAPGRAIVRWYTSGGADSSIECASVTIADWQVCDRSRPKFKLVLSCRLGPRH